MKRTIVGFVLLLAAGCLYVNLNDVPYSAYYSSDRRVAVEFPFPMCDIEPKVDPRDGLKYYPVFVHYFTSGGTDRIETNMCAIAYSSGGNWSASTKDESIVFVYNFGVYPEGTPEDELCEATFKRADGTSKRVYLEWLRGRPKTEALPFYGYYSQDRSIAVEYPLNKDPWKDPDYDKWYYPVIVHYRDGVSKRVVTNMCAMVDSGSCGNFALETEDGSVRLEDYSYGNNGDPTVIQTSITFTKDGHVREIPLERLGLVTEE